MPIHPIWLWRKENGVTALEFAREASRHLVEITENRNASISRSYVAMIENGLRPCPKEHASAFSRATKGQVTVGSILAYEAPSDAKRIRARARSTKTKEVDRRPDLAAELGHNGRRTVH